MTRPWLIYARVSTEEQGSIAAQLEACRAMLRVMGATSAEEIVDDGASGKSLARDGVQRVLAAVDASAVAGVMIWKLDRLTRSLRDLLDVVDRFAAAGVALASVQERFDTSTPLGRMVVHILGTFAQFEREVIAERVTMGIRHLKARGFFVGARVPPGCQVNGPPRQRVLTRAPGEAGDQVAALWDQVLAGRSLKECAARLSALGYGPTWTASGVHKLLLNPRLVGVLVDAAKQETVRAVLASRFSPRRGTGEQHHTSASSQDWPLRGILSCPACGTLMVGVTARSGSGTVYRYLRCGDRARRGKVACAQKDLAAEPTEAAVVEALIKAIQSEGELPAILATREADLAQRVSPARERRSALQSERDRLDVRRVNLAEAMAEGGAIARGLRPTFLALVESIDALDAQLAAVEGEIAAFERGTGSAETIAALFAQAVDGLDATPFDEQVAVVRALVRSARIVTQGGQDGIDLELNVPGGNETAPGSPEAFVGQWPMVERRTLPTIGIHAAVRVRSLREWNRR